jgi:hypothetical protein
VVDPVSQFEISHGKLGLTNMVVKGVEFGLIQAALLPELTVESGNGLEPVILIGVI